MARRSSIRESETDSIPEQLYQFLSSLDHSPTDADWYAFTKRLGPKGRDALVWHLKNVDRFALRLGFSLALEELEKHRRPEDMQALAEWYNEQIAARLG